MGTGIGRDVVFFCFLFSVFCLYFSPPTPAADISWKSAQSGDWSDANNWQGGQVPGAGDKAIISTAGNYQINVDQNVSINSLCIGANSGSQNLIITNHTMTLAARSTIGTLANVSLDRATLSGNGLLENRGGLDLKSATVNNPLFNFADIIVENITANDTRLLGGFTNATNANLAVNNTENFQATLRVDGAKNFGKIELNSESGGDVQLVFEGGANKALTNHTGATICTISGSGGRRIISGGVDTPFINNGELVAKHPIQIENRGGIVNSGLFNMTQANVTVANISNAVFANKGKLLVTVGTLMRLETGIFEPHQGRVLGDGIFEFNNITVRNGNLHIACTAAYFFGMTIFEDSSILTNEGKMFLIGLAFINADLFNLAVAFLNILNDGNNTSFFNFGGNVYNDGQVNLGSYGPASFAVSDIQFDGSMFENNGLLNSTVGENVTFSSRSINLKNGAEFLNNGKINVVTSASLNIFAVDSKFDSESGCITAGPNSFSTFSAESDSDPEPRPITMSNVHVHTTAIVSIAFDDKQGKLHLPKTTATFTNNGVTFIGNAELDNEFPDVFQGEGFIELFLAELSRSANFEQQTVGMVNSTVITGANLQFGKGANTVLSGVNQVNGSLEVATTAALHLSNETIQGVPATSSTIVKGKLENHGKVLFNSGPTTAASLQVDGGELINAGSINNPGGDKAVISFKKHSRFHNTVDGSVELQNGTTAVSRVELCQMACAINDGKFSVEGVQIVSTSQIAVSSASLSIGDDAKFNNNGELCINRTATSSASVASISDFGLNVSGNAEFTNGTTATLFVGPGANNAPGDRFTSQLPGGLHLQDNAQFNNFGQVSIKRVANTSASVFEPSVNHVREFLANQAVFNNHGEIEINEEFPSNGVAVQFDGDFPEIPMSDEARLVNIGKLFVNKVNTNATLRAKGNAVFENNGTVDIQQANTSAGVIIQSHAKFVNDGTVKFGQRQLNAEHGIQAAGDGPAVVQVEFFGNFENQTNGNVEFNNPPNAKLLKITGNGQYQNCGNTNVSGDQTMLTSASIAICENGIFTHKGGLIVSNATLLISSSQVSAFNIQGFQSNITLQNANFDAGGTTATTFSEFFSLNGSGTFRSGSGIVNPGTTNPGNSPGILTAVGTYELTSTSTVGIEIGGTTPGTGHDQLGVTGALTLQGTLNLSLIDGFVPSDGDKFVVFEYASVTGAFASINGLQQAGGVSLQLDFGATQAVVTAEVPDQIQVDVEVYFQGYWDGTKHRRTAFMLELREGPKLSTSALVARESALHSTGATTRFAFDNVNDGDYWLIVRHGGHLPLASADRMPLSAGAISNIDFSKAAKVSGGLLWLTDLPGDVKGALAGELNADNSISADDFVQLFTPNFGIVNPGQVPILDD